MAQDTLLTHTGAGTPCGAYLRRHWHPFMLSSELKDLPIAVRLFGEDLVVFRDGSGQIGLLGKHCAHRGTSLEFGIPQERGIRCCYHGWQFDVDGTIIDTPAEPPTSTIKSRIRQRSYVVHEQDGLLFTYMGEPETVPPFPILDTMHAPGNKSVPFRIEMPCNWLQVVENACDPIHNVYLHAVVSNLQFSAAFATLPALDFIETPLGFLSMATRRVKEFVFCRASDIILPNIGQFTGSANNADAETFRVGCGRTRWVVPVDDVNCHYIGYVYFNELHTPYGNLREEDIGVGRAGLIGQTADRPYQARQREPGDYDAVASQGAIADRDAEHLGTTDRGVVMFRRMLAKEINAMLEERETGISRQWVAGGDVTTYAHEYSLRVPADKVLASHDELRQFGQRTAKIVIEKGQDQTGSKRETAVLDDIQNLFSEELT